MIKNTKIRTRMLISYAAIIVLCLAASVIALFKMDKISRNLTSFYDNNYTVTVNAWMARREMQYARADILKAILETDKKDTRAAIDNASEALANMRATFPVIRKRFKGNVALVDELDSILKQAIVYRDQVLKLALEGHNDEAFDLMKNEYGSLLNQMADVLEKISDQAESNAAAMVDEGQQLQKTSMFIVIAAISLCIALAVILGIYISNGIRRPVEEIKTAAEKLAAGRLDVYIGYQSKDELGSLSDSIRSLIHTFRGIIDDMSCILASLSSGDFTVESKASELYTGDFRQMLVSMRQITGKLNRAMEEISAASGQVFAGSDQFSAGAQTLAQGSAEQAGSVEELAAAINEISDQVKETASNASDARCLTDHTGDQVASSNMQMQEMIASMNEINDKAGQISQIISTIENIAFQTHILALNAAVEAAHAGAAGKGFAVVADEVRNLAAKSREALKNTTVLIEDTVQAVEKGTGIADAAAKSLQAVVEGTREVVSTVDNIALAAEQQADSIAHITQGIDRISDVVQTNSATAEESAAASEELAGQAQTLKNLVEKFKLRDAKAADS